MTSEFIPNFTKKIRLHTVSISYIFKNQNWFINECDTKILAKIPEFHQPHSFSMRCRRT